MRTRRACVAILRARSGTLHGLAWSYCARATAANKSPPLGAAVDRATAELVELETVASRYVVRAPRAGMIEALPYKLGEQPAAGGPVVVMLADGTPYARVYVPEPLRSRFRAGSKVRATVDGEAQAFNGTVRYVSAEAEFHAVLRADAKRSVATELPRRSHARRRARVKATGGRAGASAHAGPGLKRDA